MPAPHVRPAVRVLGPSVQAADRDEKLTGMKSDAVWALLLGTAVALASTLLAQWASLTYQTRRNGKRDGPTSNAPP